jgi:hypothetical protein
VAVFLVDLALFVWVYFAEPIEKYAPIPNADYVNNKVVDALIMFPAVVTAVLGIGLTRQFQPSEPPYRIWLTFTLGWWCWVGGELLGVVYDYFYWGVDYPEITFIDLAWTLGYIFFGLALYFQFHLIYRHKEDAKLILYLGFIALGLLLTFGLTQGALAAGLGQGTSWFGVYLSIIYPVFDLFIGGAALWLFFLFQRGYLGRPWWGLIAFAVADSVSIYSWLGGFDKTPQAVYDIIDLLSNMSYMAGYMITALAFYTAIEHIRYGIRARVTLPSAPLLEG